MSLGYDARRHHTPAAVDLCRGGEPCHAACEASSRSRVGRSGVRRALWGGAAIFGQDDPLVKTEPIAQVIRRTQQEKPAFAKRHQDLLALRYDLANRPAAGVTMSRGKGVQDGVRVKLATGMSWYRLATMTPDEIKAQNAWPEGFLPVLTRSRVWRMPFRAAHRGSEEATTAIHTLRFDFDFPAILIPEFRRVYLVTRRLAMLEGELLTTTTSSGFQQILNPNSSKGLRLLLTPFRRSRSTGPRIGAA